MFICANFFSISGYTRPITIIVEILLTKGYLAIKHSLAGKTHLRYMGNLLRKRSIFGNSILLIMMPIKALLGFSSSIFIEGVS